jgi:hypothetical protein
LASTRSYARQNDSEKTSRPEIRHRYCFDARADKNSAQNREGNAELDYGNESLTTITVVEQSPW